MATNFPKRARRNDPKGWMVVQDNLDFLRDQFDALLGKIKRGVATIASGGTATTVVHGLGSASYSIAVTPIGDFGAGNRWWVSGKTATQFQINISAALGATLVFDWLVKGD